VSPTLRELLEKIKISSPVRYDEPLSAHTTFRVGGPADAFVLVRTAKDVAEARAAAASCGTGFLALGAGANIVVSDSGFRGIVCDMAGLDSIENLGSTLSAGAGVRMDRLCESALGLSLSGLEFVYGMPGSVGGAVYMNARCYERSISDVLAWTEVLTVDGTVERLPFEPGSFGYKKSPFQGTGDVILGAGFTLVPGDGESIRAEMVDHRRDRESKGHYRFPCAGSVFKNDRAFGMPTGRIIDSLGLKGRSIGGAQVAPFHGNIIVNTGAATALDIKRLTDLVGKTVRERTGFVLEPEIIFIGDFEG
jgi:UDP-N-acetylmuramate dehydrogenase